MNIPRPARVATITILATILLAGCAAAEPSAQVTATPTATEDVAQPQVRPEPRQVKMVKVIDPTTVVVTPWKETDSLYGTDFTVHIEDFLTAVKSECGYDETLAFAKDALSTYVWILQYSDVNEGAWIDKKGDHNGSLSINGPTYGQQLMSHGFAYLPPADSHHLAGLQTDAQNGQVGLWGTCPGFGQ